MLSDDALERCVQALLDGRALDRLDVESNLPSDDAPETTPHIEAVRPGEASRLIAPGGEDLLESSRGDGHR